MSSEWGLLQKKSQKADILQLSLFRTTRQVAIILALSFLFVSGGLVFWQVVKADELSTYTGNSRLTLYGQNVLRGGIFDRSGKVLAMSKEAEEPGSQKYVRSYPTGDMCEPWLGYSSKVYGSSGVEKAREKTLLGLTGGSWLDMLKREFSEEKKGYDIVLTLDADLQKVAVEAMEGRVGSAVVLDPKTGEVLALVSSPRFDPNALEENWESIIGGNNSPMSNHAFSRFPPGSVMKIVSSMVLFQGGVDTGELYHCTGSTVINGQTISEQNGNAHGWVNYDMALAYSCNTYFAERGIQAGDDAFKKAVSGFGFGDRIPFDLSLEKSAISNSSAVGDNMDVNLKASSLFGQGQVLISPFHMALIVAAVANEGTMMSPYLVQRVLGPDQNMIEEAEPKVWRQPLSAAQAAKIKNGMIEAVRDPQGTAGLGMIPGVTVAAKTGSAEPGGSGQTHAWYAAFAPADDPRVAVVVLVENGGAGGKVAAPVATKIIQEALTKKGGEQ
ncbi:MAG: penicillin-binding transpeptidase domain-containing protein [Peptococcaceae bacterium]|nr:penicillin-binding transpeptidase domain-containing protein [Peptococcaceae bacterium]